MGFLENVALALAGLRASKMRALLTMLGIIIGIGSVIAIVTVGNALTGSLEETMIELGVNSIQAYVFQRENVDNLTMTEEDRISDEMLDELWRKFPNDIDFISLQQSGGYGEVREGYRRADVNIVGLNAGNLEVVQTYDLLRGRDISERDVRSARYVAGVSDKFVEKMLCSRKTLTLSGRRSRYTRTRVSTRSR